MITFGCKRESMALGTENPPEGQRLKGPIVVVFLAQIARSEFPVWSKVVVAGDRVPRSRQLVAKTFAQYKICIKGTADARQITGQNNERRLIGTTEGVNIVD
jgi:hypothetical protein